MIANHAPPRRRQPSLGRQPSATSAAATTASTSECTTSSPVFHPFNSAGSTLAESNRSKSTSDDLANSSLRSNAFLLRNSGSHANNNFEVNGLSMKDSSSNSNTNNSSNSSNSSHSNSHSQMLDPSSGSSAHHLKNDKENNNNSAFIKNSGGKSENLLSDSHTNVEPRNSHLKFAKKQVPETMKGSFFESFLLFLNIVLAICIIATLAIAIYTAFVVSEHWKRNIKTYTGDINLVGDGLPSGRGVHDEM